MVFGMCSTTRCKHCVCLGWGGRLGVVYITLRQQLRIKECFPFGKGKRKANKQISSGRRSPEKTSFISEKAAFIPQPSEACKTSWKSIGPSPTRCPEQTRYLPGWGGWATAKGRFASQQHCLPLSTLTSTSCA